MIRIRALFGLRALILLVFLVVISLMLWRALSARSEVETDVSKRPQRLLTYVVTPDAGPSFSMSEITGQLRVMSFLHLEEPLPRSEYTPQKTFDYGLEFRVVEAGKSIFSHEVWYTTRKSKSGGEGERWEIESVYYPAGEQTGEPCDPRMSEVNLAAWTGPNRTLELRSVAAKGAVPPALNVVAFASFERKQERVDWLLETTGPERLKSASTDLGLQTWSTPTQTELGRMYRRGWRRQSTVKPSQVRPLFTTDYRAVEYNPASDGQPVSKDRAIVFNIVGPATLRLAAISGKGSKEIVRIRSLSLDEKSERMSWDETSLGLTSFRDVSDFAMADETDPRFGEYVIPPFTNATLQISGLSENEFRLVTAIDRHDALQGEPQMHRAAAGGFLIQPDVKSFATWMIDENGGTEYLLANDGVDEVLLVTVRKPTDTQESKLEFEFEGTDVRGELDTASRASMFEFGTNPSLSVQAIPLTEPVSIRLVVPKGAQKLKLRGVGTHFIGVSVLTLGDDAEMTRKLRPPYDSAPDGLVWRYAPAEVSPWFTIHPEDARNLEAMKRRWRVESQVRLEPNFDSDAMARSMEELVATNFATVYDVPESTQKKGLASTVAPSSRAQTRTIHELAAQQPTTERAIETFANRWGSAHASVFPANRAWSCRLPAGKSLRLAVSSGTKSVGTPYEVLWNGKPLRRRLMRTTQDTMVISTPQELGRLNFKWDGNTKVRLSTNCRPLKPDSRIKVVRVRRVYALRRGQPIDLMLTSTDVTWLLNSVSYSAGAARVRVTVDGGEPKRREGKVNQVTAASREIEWQRPQQKVWFKGDVESTVQGAVPNSIPIGADWKPGPHRVRIESLGKGTVWMRFFRID